MSYVGAKPYPVRDGGTGQSTEPADGQLLIGNAAARVFDVGSLTAGSGIAITPGAGTLTIASTVSPPVLTPVFLARLTSTQASVTGDGTDYTPIIFDTLDTDVGLAYDNTTGLFTATSTQQYCFAFGAYVANITSGHTSLNFRIELSSGRIAYGYIGNPYPEVISGQMQLSEYVSVTMAQGETAQVSLTVDGSTKTIDVVGDNSGNYNSWFAGYLLAGNNGTNSNIDAIVDGSGNTVVPTGGLITLVNGNSVSSLSGSASHITFDVTGTTQYALQVGNASGSLDNLALGTSPLPLVSGGAGANPAFALLTVPGGGTGASTLTANAVLLGEGTSPVGFATATANAYPLVSNGAASDPSFQLLSTSGGGTGAAGSLTGVVTANGASAMTASAVTQHDVLVGGASNAITSVSPSTAGYVLTSNGVSADPSFQAPTASGLSTLTDGSSNVVSPTAGNITFVNGNNVSNLSNNPSEITFSLTGTTNHQVQLGNSSGSLTSLNPGTSGQVLISGGAGADPAFGVASVPGGGTGLGTLTAHAVLLGEGTSAVGFAGPGTSGLPLVANGASLDPAFAVLTVPGGGTGATTITNHAVVLGQGTSALSSVGPGTTGLPLVAQGASADPIFATLGVAGGGTGATTLTGILTGNGTSAITASAVTQYTTLVAGASNAVSGVGPGTSGYVLTSNGAGANPSYQSISGTFSWTDATNATYTIVANNAYVTDRSGGVNYTLPASGALGDMFKIVGKLGITTITPNAGQQLLIGSASGTVGVTGTAVGTNVGDCIVFSCITAGGSAVWRANNFVGNWNLS